jgi:peptidyl-prolyl cis-trans isomerase C
MKKMICILAGCAAGLFAADQVAATVNGKSVMKSEVISALGVIDEAGFDKLPVEEKRAATSQAVEKKLIIDALKKEGFENSKEYQDAMNRVRANLAFDVWVKKELDAIKVTEADAKSYYEKNKEKFVAPEQFRARHILVKTEAEAKAILKEISGAKNAEEKFIEQAKAHSLDGSKANGGDLGAFQKGMMVKEFEAACVKLSKNTFTKEPVKTQFGYHLIYLNDKKAGQQVAFNDVKVNLMEQLKGQKLGDKVKAKAAAEKSKNKVEIKL